MRFVDQLTGTVVSERVDRQVGDFVLRRGDGVYAYQLAVAVDDAQMQITHVVRGRDLLGSTTRQIYLQQLLELPSPSYWLHVPLVVTPEGARLAKRLRSVRIRALREAGIGAQEIVGALAHALGLRDAPTPCAVDEVRLDPSEAAQRLTRTSFEVPAAWIANAS